MNRTKYLLLSGGLLFLGILMAFLPDGTGRKELAPEKILAEINTTNRFRSTDDVAQKIIEQDPLLVLVDVRTPEAYAAYHLPGAINVPLSSLMEDDYLYSFDQKSHDMVLYSNGTIYANQAWMLLRRLRFEKIYVMEGGLNHWVETILQPAPPSASASKTEVEKYEFRKGASMFFGGAKGGAAGAPATAAPAAAPAPVKASKPKAVSGGC